MKTFCNTLRWLFCSHTIILISTAIAQEVPIFPIKTFGFYHANGRGSDPKMMAFSPDSKMLAVAPGNDDIVTIYNLQTDRSKTTTPQHGWIQSIAFSPDGKLLATGNTDGDVNLFSVQTGLKVRSFKKEAYQVFCVAFSTNGRILASGTQSDTIEL